MTGDERMEGHYFIFASLAATPNWYATKGPKQARIVKVDTTIVAHQGKPRKISVRVRGLVGLVVSIGLVGLVRLVGLVG
jgi:hypothetical protein